jgi:hypothetical protein
MQRFFNLAKVLKEKGHRVCLRFTNTTMYLKCSGCNGKCSGCDSQDSEVQYEYSGELTNMHKNYFLRSILSTLWHANILDMHDIADLISELYE